MALIKSISGIRGTIGGKPGEGLSPLDVVKFTAAYGTWLQAYFDKQGLTVVVGRDARISGKIVRNLVIGTLAGLGIDVINLGLASTPTTEMAVIGENADGGIIITASHNPKNWNALKLLNNKGEFIDDAQGKAVLEIAEKEAFVFAEVEQLGRIQDDFTYDEKHIGAILALNTVNTEAIKTAGLKVAFDGINSVGGIIGPKLLRALGCEVHEINCRPNGDFAHVAEPLPENLTEIASVVAQGNLDLGFVVDPDADRLAVVSEDGSMFGEEYTLVAVADYILGKTPGDTVSNLSSSRALRDVTARHGRNYNAAAVGEVNVVEQMHQTQAVIGGEGNGGVIYPALHSGRDALVGMALFLSLLVERRTTPTALKATYPAYAMRKDKIALTPEIDVDQILKNVEAHYAGSADASISTLDGVKIDFEAGWVHLRKSNTEPIIRVYSEAQSDAQARGLAGAVRGQIEQML